MDQNVNQETQKVDQPPIIPITSPRAPFSVITPIIALVVVLASFVIFGAFSFIPMATKTEVVYYVLGSVTSVLTSVIGYYFGSSSGSQTKNLALMKKKEES